MYRVLLRIGVILALVSVLGVSGYLVFRGFRGRTAYLRAEQAYSEGNWRDAKTNYTWYLARHPEDLEALPRYIESCLKLLNDRRGNVRDAGRAHLRLALASPSDRVLARQLVDFYRNHKLWRELDYAADIFLRKNPDDVHLLFNKALANENLGRTNQAVEGYQRLVEEGNASPETYGNLALLLQQQGLEEQAGQVIAKASAENPADLQIRLERARFLLATNDVTLAAQEIETALAGGLETGEAFLAAARVHSAQNDWAKAQALAEKAIGALPESADGYSLLVNTFLARGQVDEAIACLTGIEPRVLADNPQLYILLAELQINADRLEDADHTVEAYRAAYPGNRTLLEYLAARRLLKQGLASEAVSKLEIVVEQAPELRVARYFLALAYLDNGQRDRAKNTLELYINSNPGDPRASAMWDVTFAERSGQDAERAALTLLDSDTPYFGSLLSAAYSLTRRGSGTDEDGKRLELARRLFERAIEQSPSTPDGYRDLGFLCLDQGDLDGARQALARAGAAGIAPSGLILLQSGLALAELKLDEAKAYFDEELALGPITSKRAMKWADLFAGRGHLEAALELLDSVRAHEGAEGDHRELDLGQVALCIRRGDFERARTLIERLADQYADAPTVARRLNDNRMAIARALLVPGDQQDKPTSERLIADVERIEPDRTDAKILRTRLLLEQDPPDVDGADKLCAAAREGGASGAETFLISGEIAYRKGQFANALDYAVKANAASPDDVNTCMALARAQVQMGRFPDAVMTLEKVHSLLPENRTTLELLARAYAGASRFREAEATVRQLEAIEEGRVALPLRAWILVARREWADAEQILRPLHEANPDDLWTIHFLARAMAAQGQWDEVERFLNECVSRRPELPDFWVELGNSYLANPDAALLSKASNAFTQALVLRAGYSPALRGLLEVQLRSGDLGAALGLCERFLDESPNDPRMLERKASLLAQLPGRRQEALGTIQRAIEITPRPVFFYLRGCLRLDLGDFANAIEDFQRVDQAGGAGPGDLDTLLAEAYLGLNNTDLARVYYDAAKNKGSGVKPADAARLDAIAARLAEEQNK